MAVATHSYRMPCIVVNHVCERRLILSFYATLDEDILHDEQHGENVERRVELLPVQAEHVDKHV